MRGILAGIAAAALAALTFVAGGAPAMAQVAAGAMAEVDLASLPPQARETYALIRKGGPFPYERDGVVFRNRERLLPPQARGYYHEYTVRTPGATNRGARRIVCGGAKREPDACYYTDDHYRSFRRIRE